MKILFMTDRYPPYYDGGYEINCEATSDAMRERGHETVILTSMYGLDGPAVKDGVYRVMYSLGRDEGRGVPRRLRHMLNAYLGRLNYGIAYDVMQDVLPDIAFVFRMGHVSIFPLKAAGDLGIPSVYRLGDRWLSEFRAVCRANPSRIKGRYRNSLFGGYHLDALDFSNMISISNALMNDYRRAGFDARNFSIIPPGVSSEIVSAVPREWPSGGSGPVRLLYAGRLTEEKGVHVGVDAVWQLAGRLAPREVTLDIIGGGPEAYVASLEDRIFRRGLGSNVRIMSRVPQAELVKCYEDYDAFLFTSLWEEPFGMTIIEAMSRGLPVIASSVGGVPEIITDMHNGMLVPRGDAEAIADRVFMLANNPELAAGISAEGLRTVQDKYTNDRVMTDTEGYLLEVYTSLNLSAASVGCVTTETYPDETTRAA